MSGAPASGAGAPGATPAAPEVALRTYRPGDEQAIVDLMNAAYPDGWGTLDQWRAKHGGRPGFDPRDIYVAEVGGRLVGCLHTMVMPVHLGPERTVMLSLDGDLAVGPEGRGLAIPERLYAFSRAALTARGVHLRGGYTSVPLWEKFYRPRIGYVCDFDASLAHRKVLDPTPVRDRILALFGATAADPDPGRGPLLEVAITGLEPLRFRLGARGFALATDPAARPALRLESDQRIFGLFAPDGPGPRGLPALARGGGLRLRRAFPGLLPVALWFLRCGRVRMRAARAR